MSDMGGSNDRFYNYLRDGHSIISTKLWPKDQVVVQNPVDHNTLDIVPGANIDHKTVGTDVNTFVGFSLFSLKKRYGNIEVLAPGHEEEDKFWLLTDMVALEADIVDNDEYLSKYYDSYYVILNRGDMTLVSPRYITLCHEILYKISMRVNMKKMIENKGEFVIIAREMVEKNLPAWSVELRRLSEGVHLVNAEKACNALMSEIVQKTFNAKVSSVIKRYHSMFLARGGKEASRSSLREVRKQEGLGSKKTQKNSDAAHK